MTEKHELNESLWVEIEAVYRDLQPERGGYLVPPVIRINSAGVVAATYRLLGRLLGDMVLFERGREDCNVWQMLREKTDRDWLEIQKR